MVLTEEEKKLQKQVTEVAWKDEKGTIIKGKKVVDYLPGNRRQPGKDFEYEVVFLKEQRYRCLFCLFFFLCSLMGLYA